VLAGVCAGIGTRLGVDPVIVRVCFVAAALSGGLASSFAWAVLPDEDRTRASASGCATAALAGRPLGAGRSR
jgi:phage shock protein PspC (stress-responsive transcriptional regulator)